MRSIQGNVRPRLWWHQGRGYYVFFFDNEKLCTWACDQLKTNNWSADNFKKTRHLNIASSLQLTLIWLTCLTSETNDSELSFSFLNKCLISHWFKRSGWTVDDHRTHDFVTIAGFSYPWCPANPCCLRERSFAVRDVIAPMQQVCG